MPAIRTAWRRRRRRTPLLLGRRGTVGRGMLVQELAGYLSASLPLGRRTRRPLLREPRDVPAPSALPRTPHPRPRRGARTSGAARLFRRGSAMRGTSTHSAPSTAGSQPTRSRDTFPLAQLESPDRSCTLRQAARCAPHRLLRRSVPRSPCHRGPPHLHVALPWCFDWALPAALVGCTACGSAGCRVPCVRL